MFGFPLLFVRPGLFLKSSTGLCTSCGDLATWGARLAGLASSESVAGGYLKKRWVGGAGFLFLPHEAFLPVITRLKVFLPCW
jgi:hypothetical protein